ncbi:MAG: Coq4 family protein [Actinomycetota bacterium]
MTATITDYEPVIDRDIAELFMRNVDDPLQTHVMGLVHDWWETAPQSAIDQYADNLRALPGADAFLDEQYLPPVITLEDLAGCPDGSLGHAYKHWIVDNNLEPNLARNQHEYFYNLVDAGRLDRMPDDVKYAFLRGFMLHDYLHTITGFHSDIVGELGMAGFHHAQLRTTYHAMRIAVTTSHVAFVNPSYIATAMDAISEGWMMGQSWKNLHFTKWEEQLDRPLADIRAEYGPAT